MANSLGGMIKYIDTAGATSAFAPTGGVVITGFQVVASADTWSAILHDESGGNVIFRADSNVANHRSYGFTPAAPVWVKGVYATTLTDIACVLVYTAKQDWK